MQATISKLHVYPVKSMQGIEVPEITCWETGVEFDREWVVIDEKNLFVTQRQLPKLATIHVALSETHLVLSHPDHESLRIPLSRDHLNDNEHIPFTIWKDQGEGINEGQVATDWLEKVLGKYRGGKLRLLRFALDYRRAVHEKYSTHPTAHLKFADACPYLIVNTASLEALNAVLRDNQHEPVTLDRFRGNIEIQSNTPWMEYQGSQIKVNDVVLKGVGPCMRCPMIGMDQETGEVIEPGQPFKTLMEMPVSTHKDGAFFGMHASFLSGNGMRIKLGDTLQIIPSE